MTAPAEYTALHSRIFADPTNADPADIRRLLELHDEHAARQAALADAQRCRQADVAATEERVRGIERITRALARR